MPQARRRMNNAVDITRYRFQPDEQLLLDANVWLSILGPRGPSSWDARTYSKAFGQMLTEGSSLFVDATVLCEFVNAYVRIEQGMLRNANPSVPAKFKSFRQSSHFLPVAIAVADDTRRLLSFCRKIETGFPQVDVLDIMDTFKRGRQDFNDLLLVELCRARNLKFVTNDRDFKGLGIPILTANRQLLS